MTSNGEYIPFEIHPAAILTLIKEQAGTLEKALAELVMNSIDAGATRIDITLDPDTMTLTLEDDGRGFNGRDEINRFFKVFGTPHASDDDATFGKFRMGRGQIMAFGACTWRSGPWRMHVDLDQPDAAHGFNLRELDEHQPGCLVTAVLAAKNEFQLSNLDFAVRKILYPHEYYIDGPLHEMVKFVSVPVFLNGEQINTPAQEQVWELENDYAYYQFERNTHAKLKIYNQGVLVQALASDYFGCAGVVVSKSRLKVNLARNELLVHQCENWRHIAQGIQKHFVLRLGNAKKLEGHEGIRLLRDLLNKDIPFTFQVLQAIRKIRFIPDLHDNLITPEKFFSGPQNYTIYDGHNLLTAERIQSSGAATVLTPEFLSMANLPCDDTGVAHLIKRLAKRLLFSASGYVVAFDELLKDFDGTNEDVALESLTQEERLVFDCLKAVNKEIAACVNGSWGYERTLLVGKSDDMEAWTDGVTYIKFDRRTLQKCRRRGPLYLCHVLAHEYAHKGPSAGEHGHDFDFFRDFHNSVMDHDFSVAVDSFFRRYLLGLRSYQIIPSGPIAKHVRHICQSAVGIPSGRRTYASQLHAALYDKVPGE